MQCSSHFDHTPTRRVASRDLGLFQDSYYLYSSFGDKVIGDGNIFAIHGLGLREELIAISTKHSVIFVWNALFWPVCGHFW